MLVSEGSCSAAGWAAAAADWSGGVATGDPATYKLANKESAQNKDQRSDGMTDGQTGVFIHWDIKHTKRIMGCEEGLNNH